MYLMNIGIKNHNLTNLTAAYEKIIKSRKFHPKNARLVLIFKNSIKAIYYINQPKRNSNATVSISVIKVNDKILHIFIIKILVFYTKRWELMPLIKVYIKKMRQHFA